MYLPEEGLGDVFLDHVHDLQVVRVKVVGGFTHSCPRFFTPGAYCAGVGNEGCNVKSEVEGEFDMWAYEEEMYFMK